MIIGPANEETKKMGGSSVVILDDADIEKLGEAIYYGDSKPIADIVAWAHKKGKGEPFIDGGKIIFIQTGDSENLQYSLPVANLRKALDRIL